MTDLRSALKNAFKRRGIDRWGLNGRPDVTRWWRDPAILGQLGPALASPLERHEPTVTRAPQTRGTMLGTLVATHLQVSLVDLRHGPAETRRPLRENPLVASTAKTAMFNPGPTRLVSTRRAFVGKIRAVAGDPQRVRFGPFAALMVCACLSMSAPRKSR